jgi:hypothetical protein
MERHKRELEDDKLKEVAKEKERDEAHRKVVADRKAAKASAADQDDQDKEDKARAARDQRERAAQQVRERSAR